MPPDQYRFQKTTQDFQSARLFGAAEPLLEAIESRGRMHSADQKLIILSRLYATNLTKSHLYPAEFLLSGAQEKNRSFKD
jgi:hypothetical protein